MVTNAAVGRRRKKLAGSDGDSPKGIHGRTLFTIYISDLGNKKIRLELTKLLASFYAQIQLRFVFQNTRSVHFFSISKIVYLVAYKAL